MINIIKEKECKKCNEIKSINEFYKASNLKDGYENSCKKCRNEARKKHVKNCEFCDKEFKTRETNTRFCSNRCMGENRKTRVKVNCSSCNKEVEIIPSKEGKFKNYYCDINCKAEHQKSTMMGENNHNFTSVLVNCDGCNKEIYRQPLQLDNLKHHFCDYECYQENIGQYYIGEDNSNYNRIKVNCNNCNDTLKVKFSIYNKNKNHYCSTDCFHDFIGEGITDEDRIKSRNYPEYNNWRVSVFERDNYTAQCCGQLGGNLVAHHILNYSEYPQLRTKVSNGTTLCKTHHKLFHDTYGYTNNNKTQLEEFINNIQMDVVFL